MQLMSEFQVEVKLIAKNDVQQMLVVIYANCHRAKYTFERKFTSKVNQDVATNVLNVSS